MAGATIGAFKKVINDIEEEGKKGEELKKLREEEDKKKEEKKKAQDEEEKKKDKKPGDKPDLGGGDDDNNDDDGKPPKDKKNDKSWFDKLKFWRKNSEEIKKQDDNLIDDNKMEFDAKTRASLADPTEFDYNHPEVFIDEDLFSMSDIKAQTTTKDGTFVRFDARDVQLTDTFELSSINESSLINVRQAVVRYMEALNRGVDQNQLHSVTPSEYSQFISLMKKMRKDIDDKKTPDKKEIMKAVKYMKQIRQEYIEQFKFNRYLKLLDKNSSLKPANDNIKQRLRKRNEFTEQNKNAKQIRRSKSRLINGPRQPRQPNPSEIPPTIQSMPTVNTQIVKVQQKKEEEKKEKQNVQETINTEQNNKVEEQKKEEEKNTEEETLVHERIPINVLEEYTFQETIADQLNPATYAQSLTHEFGFARKPFPENDTRLDDYAWENQSNASKKTADIDKTEREAFIFGFDEQEIETANETEQPITKEQIIANRIEKFTKTPVLKLQKIELDGYIQQTSDMQELQVQSEIDVIKIDPNLSHADQEQVIKDVIQQQQQEEDEMQIDTSTGKYEGIRTEVRNIPHFDGEILDTIVIPETMQLDQIAEVIMGREISSFEEPEQLIHELATDFGVQIETVRKEVELVNEKQQLEEKVQDLHKTIEKSRNKNRDKRKERKEVQDLQEFMDAKVNSAVPQKDRMKLFFQSLVTRRIQDPTSEFYDRIIGRNRLEMSTSKQSIETAVQSSVDLMRSLLNTNQDQQNEQEEEIKNIGQTNEEERSRQLRATQNELIIQTGGLEGIMELQINELFNNIKDADQKTIQRCREELAKAIKETKKQNITSISKIKLTLQRFLESSSVKGVAAFFTKYNSFSELGGLMIWLLSTSMSMTANGLVNGYQTGLKLLKGLWHVIKEIAKLIKQAVVSGWEFSKVAFSIGYLIFLFIKMLVLGGYDVGTAVWNYLSSEEKRRLASDIIMFIPNRWEAIMDTFHRAQYFVKEHKRAIAYGAMAVVVGYVYVYNPGFLITPFTQAMQTLSDVGNWIAYRGLELQSAVITGVTTGAAAAAYIISTTLYYGLITIAIGGASIAVTASIYTAFLGFKLYRKLKNRLGTQTLAEYLAQTAKDIGDFFKQAFDIIALLFSPMTAILNWIHSKLIKRKVKNAKVAAQIKKEKEKLEELNKKLKNREPTEEEKKEAQNRWGNIYDASRRYRTGLESTYANEAYKEYKDFKENSLKDKQLKKQLKDAGVGTEEAAVAYTLFDQRAQLQTAYIGDQAIRQQAQGRQELDIIQRELTQVSSANDSQLGVVDIRRAAEERIRLQGIRMVNQEQNSGLQVTPYSGGDWNRQNRNRRGKGKK